MHFTVHAVAPQAFAQWLDRVRAGAPHSIARGMSASRRKVKSRVRIPTALER